MLLELEVAVPELTAVAADTIGEDEVDWVEDWEEDGVED